MAEMAVAAGSRHPAPLAPVYRLPDALPSAGRTDRPPLHHHERGSPMKNRKLETCTSGSVRDEAGQPPHLLGRRQFLHLAAGAAASSAGSPFALTQPNSEGSSPKKGTRVITLGAKKGPFPPAGPGQS